MDWQWVADGLFALSGILLGMLYSDVRKDMAKQDKVLDALTEKIHEVDKLVAGNYVHKNDLKEITNALFNKLELICEKLDRKADK
ncbi:MAG: hypothetical protein PHE73_03655 [Sulfurovaceae bacterium]|nr:hypothetical protein [Sulfurovaceae bacterium]